MSHAGYKSDGDMKLAERVAPEEEARLFSIWLAGFAGAKRVSMDSHRFAYKGLGGCWLGSGFGAGPFRGRIPPQLNLDPIAIQR